MDLSAMWVVPFIEDVCGVSADLASVVAMSLSIAATIGAPTMPILAEKVGARKRTMIVAFSIGTLSCLVMTLFGHMFNVWIVAVFYFVIRIGIYVPQGVALPMFKEYGDAGMTGTLVGAGNAGPFIGSGVLQIVSSALFGSFGTHQHYPFRAYQIGLWALLT
jgi:MFS family permease